MREIKFRAWEPKKLQMWTPQYRAPYEMLRDAARSSAILMQYTGLKDRNGVEIYEGDILKYSGKRHDGSKYEGVYQVDWGICGHSDRGIGWQIDPDEVIKEEVIGNIYEHPHLLQNGGRDE